MHAEAELRAAVPALHAAREPAAGEARSTRTPGISAAALDAPAAPARRQAEHEHGESNRMGEAGMTTTFGAPRRWAEQVACHA